MWTTAFIFFALYHGNLAANIDCSAGPVANGVEDTNPSFPENAEELLKICDFFLSNTRRMLNYAEMCGGDQNEMSKMRSVISYLERSCLVGSQTYKSIADSLDCIKPIFAKVRDECSKPDDQRAMKFFTFLMDLSERGIKQGADSDDVLPECLDILYFDACSAAEVGKKCGAEPRNAVVDILQNMDIKLKKCRQEVIEHMMNLVTDFEKEI